MIDQQKSLALRPNGIESHPEQTKAVWAAAGGAALSAEVVKALALVGQHYNLDPALGELMILGNKVYITLEGYLRVAEQHPAYEGYELWALTVDERKALKVGDDEHGFGCRVWRKDRRFPSVGYGVASDRSIQAGPIKVFARELAEKRAIHRAHRMAFRVGLPDAEDAIQQYEQTGRVALPVIEQAPTTEPEPPALPRPDWASFWIHVKGLGVEHEEAHRILGVASVKDWAGSLEEAVTTIEKYVLTRDKATAIEKPQAPPETPKSWTRPELQAKYHELSDQADTLSIPHDTFDPKWPNAELLNRCRELKVRCREAELAIPARESA
jgi:hypothetical protein